MNPRKNTPHLAALGSLRAALGKTLIGAVAVALAAASPLTLAACSEDKCDKCDDETCQDAPAEIEITSPDPGATYDDQETDICWRDTAPEGSTYEVDYVYERCPDAEELEARPHPYGELLPNPEDRQQLRDLRRQRRHGQEVADYWEGLCADQEGEPSRVAAAQADLDTMLQNLDTLIASDDLGVEPPESCDIEDECCNDQPCCEGLDLTTREGREEYARRLECLERKVRSFESIRISSQAEFYRLLARWRSGADHRATMSFYDSYFQLIDDTIDVVNKVVGVVVVAAGSAVSPRPPTKNPPPPDRASAASSGDAGAGRSRYGHETPWVS